MPEYYKGSPLPQNHQESKIPSYINLLKLSMPLSPYTIRHFITNTSTLLLSLPFNTQYYDAHNTVGTTMFSSILTFITIAITFFLYKRQSPPTIIFSPSSSLCFSCVIRRCKESQGIWNQLLLLAHLILVSLIQSPNSPSNWVSILFFFTH